jgi:hypothetical protein
MGPQRVVVRRDPVEVDPEVRGTQHAIGRGGRGVESGHAPPYPPAGERVGYGAGVHPLLTTAASAPLGVLVGFGLTRAARSLIIDTLRDARVQVVITEPGWGLGVDLTGAAALGIGALAAGLVVSLTGRIGDRGFTPSRLLKALISATSGMVVGLAGAAFHTARAAVPAAMNADVRVITPVLDADTLLLGGWAAGGVAAGLVVYGALTTLAGLLGSD